MNLLQPVKPRGGHFDGYNANIVY